MNNSFTYFMPTKIQFECGAVKKLGEHVSGENILIVTDPFLYKIEVAQQMAGYIQGKNVHIFSEVEPNPSGETVDLGAALAREIKADCIIGIGGGSSLDTAKAISCLIHSEGSIYDYFGGKKQLLPRVAKLICIPTTAGTGSEVTNVGVYTDKKVGAKMPMVTPEFWPDLAIVDPELTYTLPLSATASTGMDAFCHAIEAYWNIQSQPMCDFLAMGAMELIIQNIKTVCYEPSHIEARKNMAMASMMAGVAFSQTRTTGIHALSFPLTNLYGANHGTACSITLPAFIKLSYEGAKEKMDKLLGYLGFNDIVKFAQYIEDLLKDIKMPTRLSELGIKEEEVERIAEIGMKPNIMYLTPGEISKEKIHHLLQSIL